MKLDDTDRDIAGVAFAASNTAWTTAFNMLLTIEWLRLKDGKDPSMFDFSDEQFQRRWDGFVQLYREKVHPSNIQAGPLSEEQLIAIWLDVQVRSLRKLRARIDC